MAPDRPPRPFFFFAARPPDNVVTSIAQAWETLGTGEPLRRDKLHVTLLPVPELPDAEITFARGDRRADTCGIVVETSGVRPKLRPDRDLAPWPRPQPPHGSDWSRRSLP